jgi:hypothetical protein
MLIHSLSCMETFPRLKYLTCNTLHHTVSNFLLSDLDSVCSKPMTCIFTHVMLMEKLLIMTTYSYAIQFAVSAIQNSQILLPQIDACMMSECNVTHYNNSCSGCCTVQYLNVTKLEVGFYYYTCYGIMAYISKAQPG